ncbi:hypothetical protein L484_019070 [Morus notabilis]|uniref:Uncharacterized protein n=1 Tax=Morus notabilis TaxID=981085 RepID=W9SFR6_9ROSA|nr:hypothetical protein L484_019070 [Morus notabilis]
MRYKEKPKKNCIDVPKVYYSQAHHGRDWRPALVTRDHFSATCDRFLAISDRFSVTVFRQPFKTVFTVNTIFTRKADHRLRQLFNAVFIDQRMNNDETRKSRKSLVSR